jgi:glycosyltransferase involved in cell wall biosynthesis
LKTLSVFISEKPEIIFVQNPSIVLSFFSVTYGLLLRIPVIVDSHNAGIYPFNGKKRWANIVTQYLFRRAALTVVSNEYLAEYVRTKGGRSVAVPDPIPDIKPPTTKKIMNGTFNVMFICSWADDEPYVEVMQAAELLDKNIFIYITGNSKGKELQYGSSLPGNVVLTGYLKEEDYIEALYSCDAVLDLTTRDNCLVCGAYESVAAEKPLIVSNSKVLMEYFSKGVRYTDNTASDIAEQIIGAAFNKEKLQQKIKELKNDIIYSWNKRLFEVERMLGECEKIVSGTRH